MAARACDTLLKDVIYVSLHALLALIRMDRINGHCETVAASLSNHVLAELRNGTPPDVALRAGASIV